MTAFTPNQQRYSSVAIILHWLIAGLLVAVLSTGIWRYGIGGTRRHMTIPLQEHTFVFGLHMLFGATILILSIARLGWRLANPPPPFDSAVSKWERRAANTAYFVFYCLMIAMPLIGTAIMSSYPHKTGAFLDGSGGGIPFLFGIPWPTIPGLRDMALPARAVYHAILDKAHTIGGYTFLVLILVHIAGALKHQFIDRHPEIQRMWFGRWRPARTAALLAPESAAHRESSVGERGVTGRLDRLPP